MQNHRFSALSKARRWRMSSWTTPASRLERSVGFAQGCVASAMAVAASSRRGEPSHLKEVEHDPGIFPPLEHEEGFR